MALRDESTIKKMLTQFSEWVRKKCEIDEFTAMEKLLKDLEISGNLSIASFKLEALLVIDRIGSRIFPGPHPYFLRQLVARANILSNEIENPTIRLDMLMLSLEMFQLGQYGNSIPNGLRILFVMQSFGSSLASTNCLICL